MNKARDVKFKKWNCEIELAAYSNGRIAILLNDKDTGEHILTASVNVPEYNLKEDELFIKDWSENEGILKALCEAQIIEDLGQSEPMGFVDAHLCRLLINKQSSAT